MKSLPTFRYFADPAGAGSIEESEDPCDCCGKAHGWLSGCTFYSSSEATKEEPRICPLCISTGKAAKEWSGTFNHLEGSSSARRAEIEQRTPGFRTWQDLIWPVCQGGSGSSRCVNEPLAFLGYGHYSDFISRWAEAGAALKREYEESPHPLLGAASAEEFLRLFEAEANPGAYVFQCLGCGAYQVRWDYL